MNYSVAVPLKSRTDGTLRFGSHPALAFTRKRGIFRKSLFFSFTGFFSDTIHQITPSAILYLPSIANYFKKTHFFIKNFSDGYKPPENPYYQSISAKNSSVFVTEYLPLLTSISFALKPSTISSGILKIRVTLSSNSVSSITPPLSGTREDNLP